MEVKKICDSLREYQKEKENKICEVCNKLKKFAKYKYEMRLKGFNDFNYIELLKGAYDENTHSKIIAEFLNPQGSHYQGNLFLENFFKQCKINWNLDNWEVFTEKFVENCVDKGQGRIDIYLTNGKKHIIIENKIHAKDQEAQIYKYVECLYKENENLDYKDVLVVYLTPDRHTPSKNSLNIYEIKNEVLESNGDKKAIIKCISYKEILKWMNENLKLMENISNLREAIKQYIKTLKKILNKEDNVMNLKDYLLKEENKEILIMLIDNKTEFDKFVENDEECKKIVEEENLDSVLEEILLDFRKKIVDKILEILPKYFSNYEIVDYNFGEKDSPLIFFNKKWGSKENVPLLHYGLEFSMGGFRKLLYGIRKFSEQSPYEKQNIPNELKKIFDIDNSFKISNWWLSYKYFAYPYDLTRYDFWENKDVKNLYLEILTTDLDDFVEKHYITPLKEYIEKTEKIIEMYLNSINQPQ